MSIASGQMSVASGQMSVASAKGLVMFIVMNVASWQMPKVKCKKFIEYICCWCCSFWLKLPVVSCHSVIFLWMLPVVRHLKVKTKSNIFLIFGPDLNVLIWWCSLLPDVSCQWPDVSCQCKGFGDVHCDEYCQLSDAIIKVSFVLQGWGGGEWQVALTFCLKQG